MKEGKNYAMLNGHRWFLQKKQKGLGINYIIDKNHGLITLPYQSKRYVFSLLISQITMMRV
jgi:hypothetical protein